MGVKKKHTVSLRFLGLMCTVMSYQHEIRTSVFKGVVAQSPNQGASDTSA